MSNPTTNQEVFNRAWNHILKQGGPSISPTGWGCYYHGLEGTSCAMAPFIKDYDEKLEGKPIDVLIYKEPEYLDPILLKACPSFCLSLQQCHDSLLRNNNFTIERFKLNMIQVATKYNLEVPLETT